MCIGCLLYSRTSHWWCSAKYTASHTNCQLVWSMIVKCSDFHDTEQPAGARIIVDDWFFMGFLILVSHCTVARCPLKRLRITCKLLQDRSIGLKRTRSILLWNSNKKPRRGLIGNRKPCNLPFLKRLGSAHVGICRTARNGTSYGLGSKSTSTRIGTRTYQWCKECMSTWDWSNPPFGQTHLKGTVSFCVVDIHPIVINKNCANKKQKQIRWLYFLGGKCYYFLIEWLGFHYFSFS